MYPYPISVVIQHHFKIENKENRSYPYASLKHWSIPLPSDSFINNLYLLIRHQIKWGLVSERGFDLHDSVWMNSSSCAFRELSMSRDGWMRKKANAGGDNGWADRVSICHVSVINNV